jgi:nucleotide-binding universal stress UspA family protein
MRVLYLTDGRPPAIAAADLLTAIADPAGIEMTVLHVDEYGNKIVADRVAEEVLGEAVKYLAQTGVTAAKKRAGGGVKRAIERELVAEEYELVAMGAGNTGSLGQLILGGVSTFVLHRSRVPTLAVHRAPIRGRDRVRVIVGTDGSPAASRAIDTLIALARPDRCDIFVRSVVEPQLPPRPVPVMPTDPVGAPETMLADQNEDAERVIREALQRFSNAGFRCDGDVVSGSAEVAVLDVVHDRDADVVVVGTRGRGRFAAIALGSVSAHLVRAAPASLVAPDPGTSPDDEVVE